jgi:hypothetical protein
MSGGRVAEPVADVLDAVGGGWDGTAVRAGAGGRTRSDAQRGLLLRGRPLRRGATPGDTAHPRPRSGPRRPSPSIATPMLDDVDLGNRRLTIAGTRPPAGRPHHAAGLTGAPAPTMTEHREPQAADPQPDRQHHQPCRQPLDQCFAAGTGRDFASTDSSKKPWSKAYPCHRGGLGGSTRRPRCAARAPHGPCWSRPPSSPRSETR